MKPLILFLSITSLITAFLPSDALSAKGDLAVREEYATFETDYDQPFRATAIISGNCEDVDLPSSDSRRIVDLYELSESAPKTSKIGTFYYNDRGLESVCIEGGSLNPFVVKNVRGDVVTVLGWMTSGRDYGLSPDAVVIIESMERLGEDFE